MSDESTDSIKELEFDICWKMRYHDRACKMNMRIHRFLTSCSFISSIGAVGMLLESLGDKWNIITLILAAASSITALINIVWGFCDRATKHDRLQWRLADALHILKRIPTNLEQVRWMMSEVGKDEPPANEDLNVLCFNETCQQLDREVTYENPGRIKKIVSWTLFGASSLEKPT